MKKTLLENAMYYSSEAYTLYDNGEQKSLVAATGLLAISISFVVRHTINMYGQGSSKTKDINSKLLELPISFDDIVGNNGIICMQNIETVDYNDFINTWRGLEDIIYTLSERS